LGFYKNNFLGSEKENISFLITNDEILEKNISKNFTELIKKKFTYQNLSFFNNLKIIFYQAVQDRINFICKFIDNCPCHFHDELLSILENNKFSLKEIFFLLEEFNSYLNETEISFLKNNDNYYNSLVEKTNNEIDEFFYNSQKEKNFSFDKYQKISKAITSKQEKFFSQMKKKFFLLIEKDILKQENSPFFQEIKKIITTYHSFLFRYLQKEKIRSKSKTIKSFKKKKYYYEKINLKLNEMLLIFNFSHKYQNLINEKTIFKKKILKLLNNV
jgi:hypothetical protein